jgi:sortase A
VTRIVRGFGWLLLVSGAVILLYVVYLLWFTGLETARAQRDLASSWLVTVPSDSVDTGDDVEAPAEPITAGDAYAALWFERDGERIVSDEVLYVLEGVGLDVLRSGPGHYPSSLPPGGDGNVAIAGHRTTYGAPFWALDTLTPGDTIHLVDREGREWVYAYREQRVVQPTDLWVVEEDPLGNGQPVLTLTTCHPRGSSQQRLIAWGELLGPPLDADGEVRADGEVLEELPDT